MNEKLLECLEKRNFESALEHIVDEDKETKQLVTSLSKLFGDYGRTCTNTYVVVNAAIKSINRNR